MIDDNKPLLSVVVVSRNDDHGGNMLQRMQLFVSGFLEQAKLHNMNSELIIVEWNPLADRPRLSEALKWPENSGPCTVRFIEVSPELHKRFIISQNLPLLQMIGKNVGIRRARGQFILATNIDIIFSNEIMDFFTSGKMKKNRLYRVDRYDVSSEISQDSSMDEQLKYCSKNIIRINTREKTLAIGESQPSLINSTNIRIKKIKRLSDVFKLVKDTLQVVMYPIIYGKRLHTNAAGDFTLMARDNWFKLRGNAEFETFSMYLDGLMCATAHYSGVKEIVLKDPIRIYHIEHALGSGWAPGEGAKLLDARLKSAGIPQLTSEDYLKYVKRIHWKFGPTIFNDENWGLSNESLKVYDIIKADWDNS